MKMLCHNCLKTFDSRYDHSCIFPKIVPLSDVIDVPTNKQALIVKEILEERKAQDKKWGRQDHPPFKWIAIATEELGEIAQAALQKNYKEYRKELIQTAAVLMAAIECLDRDVWS